MQPVSAHLIQSGKLTLDDGKEAERELRRLQKEKRRSMTPEALSHLEDILGHEVAPDWLTVRESRL